VSAAEASGDSVTSVAALLASVAGSNDLPHLRVGTDVCDIALLRYQLSTTAAQRFLTSTYTPAELAYCDGRAEHLAARWAAKEAVAKAVGSGFRALRPLQIEVARLATGTPYICQYGDQPWPDAAQDWDWSVSMAHENNIAIAVAIAIVPITGRTNAG